MHKKTAIISVINAKGGVGKTTTTINLGAGLALKGFRVLLLDIDLQANLTHSLIGDLQAGVRNIAEALLEEASFDGIIRATDTQNLFFVPAGESLTGIDLDLSGRTAREKILQSCIEQTRGIEEFDAILIDNPPYFSLMSLNSLVASTHYLIPVSCDYLPMVGLRLLNEKIDIVRKKRLNSHLQNLGVLLTMYDRREGIGKDVESAMRKEMPHEVFNTNIRINTKIKSTALEKVTIFELEQSQTGKKGSEDYDQLTDEVIKRLQEQGYLKQQIKECVHE